ncbi:MAG: hypothetical protein JWM55_556 [Acidimicrobiaceae bacterium]|nr:hypothetical protein [Acidimicrobiaceae bacterium]
MVLSPRETGPRHTVPVSNDLPNPSDPRGSRAEVFLSYLEYFRNSVISRVAALSESEVRTSHVPSGWTPIELVKHLTFVEHRWLVWGFEGAAAEDPWGERRDDRWFVDPGEPLESVIEALRSQGEQSEIIIRANDLETVGQPGPRWKEGVEATLERILIHLLQEYSRHLGHLDIVVEVAGGPVGE